ALSQHKRVLRTNGDDESGTCHEAGRRGSSKHGKSRNGKARMVPYPIHKRKANISESTKVKLMGEKWT
ncbi:hypothetical protein K4H02_27795, partial [Mycobacterium tuberculosis]|nr:hypothetical protein [Mycobacterium tuberculosis]